MNSLDGLPTWIAALVATLVLGGATLAFIGALGLTRLRTFYSRLHAPTLGTTLGAAMMAMASVLYHSTASGEGQFGSALIIPFLGITTPITMLLLGRAALMRDRSEGHDPSKVEPPH